MVVVPMGVFVSGERRRGWKEWRIPYVLGREGNPGQAAVSRGRPVFSESFQRAVILRETAVRHGAGSILVHPRPRRRGGCVAERTGQTGHNRTTGRRRLQPRWELESWQPSGSLSVGSSNHVTRNPGRSSSSTYVAPREPGSNIPLAACSEYVLAVGIQLIFPAFPSVRSPFPTETNCMPPTRQCA
jgi:hypothetical protein